MHTDEYEISIARERNHCQQVVKKIQTSLTEWRRKFAMEYPEAAKAFTEGRLAITEKELAEWQDDIEALPVWEQRLDQYREALTMMRVSTQRL